MKDTTTDRRVRAILLEGALAARTGYDPNDTRVCSYCGAIANARDGAATVDGFLCDGCHRHPRFDYDACPRCNEPWSETMKPCPSCGLTVETVAERFAAAERAAGRKRTDEVARRRGAHNQRLHDGGT